MKHDIYIWEHNSYLLDNDLNGLVEEVIYIYENYQKIGFKNTFDYENTIQTRPKEKFFKITSELNKESLVENLKDLFLIKDIIL